MHRPTTLKLLVCLLAGSVAAQRKGGGGGGGGGSDNDHDGGSSGGGGDDDDDGDTDDSSGGGSSLPDNSAPCGYYSRIETFGLPGVYYNGTLTVRHHISHNSAWDDESEPIDLCDNDDRSPKTHKYPAMVLIAPTGNDSDTNPMHWVLRGFQPAYEYHRETGVVDFRQRWVYIRSSDFVITNYTQEYDSPFSPYRTDRYEESDATNLDQTTRVYWPTNITSEGDNVFSARAEYAQAPPIIDRHGRDFTSISSPGKHTSQYTTLKSICRLNQKWLQDPDDVDKVRGTASTVSRRQDERDKFDENGERIWYASTPTFWLSEGATVEMAGIGADQMTLTLNNSLNEAIPWHGQRQAGCYPDERTPFELSDFYPSQSSNYEGTEVRPWNVTLSVSMSFEGSIVRENSTTVDGMEAGKLLFGAGYRLAEMAREEEEEKSVASLSTSQGYVVLLAAMAIGIMMV